MIDLILEQDKRRHEDWLDLLQMTREEYVVYLQTGQISHAAFVEREVAVEEFRRTLEVTDRVSRQNATEMWRRIGVTGEVPFFW